jgi:hypothetical protein
MDTPSKSVLQQKVDSIPSFWVKSLHSVKETPVDFRPWLCGLSPSALYSCSLGCRKKMGIKAPEVKWMSIKRWVSITPGGITLPTGIFLSIKRFEKYCSEPKPHFDKVEFILLMFPYGNIWSQISPGVPITEEWMWSEIDGVTMLEALVRKDASRPIIGYFKSCHNYMLQNPDQIGIHLKRKAQLKHKA